MYPIQRTTALVRQLLSTHTTGTVHSVYRKTINLSLGNLLIAIQATGSPLSPISLITSLTEQEISQLPISAGQSVSFTGQFIECPQAMFCLDMAQTIDTKLMPIAQSSVPSVTACICSILKHSGKSGFRHILFPSTLSTQLGEQLILSTSKTYMDLCAQQLHLCDNTTAAHTLCKLIGLGIGLTPSGDDFLCGVLAGLLLRNGMHHPFALALQQQLAAQLSDTNDISRTFLRCALHGQFSEAVCLLSHVSDETQLSDTFSAIGHSSGMDTLCGIWYALTLDLPG